MTNESGPSSTRARSIARWSTPLVVGIVAFIAATTVRVAQLKTAPEERLVRSMERPNGQLVQQRALLEPEPRGRIVDRVGRLLALDSVGGRLFVDVKDLYADALREAERTSRAARRARLDSDAGDANGLAATPISGLDPIAMLAAELERPLGVPAADIARTLREAVPADLALARPDFTDADWARLPRFVVLSQDLTEAQVAAIDEARRIAGPRGVIRGAHVQSKSTRVRPFEELAAAIVGRTGFDGKGQTGAELGGERLLASEAGRTLYFADARGQVISVPANGHLAGRAGGDVRLSIDMVAQEVLEREINRVVAESNAGGGRGIVMDVETGEILAAHDVLRNTGRSPIAVDANRAIDASLGRLRWMTDPFEPGSIFKPFVWAWSIELRKARPNESIALPDGPKTFTDGRARRTVREAHPSSYGTKTWAECLTKSVNSGMATVALRMSGEELKDGLRSFGFGRRTGLALPHESGGILPPADEWSNRTRAQVSVSFGQGIAVTPVQLLTAFTAFCRDGTMVLPMIEPPEGTARAQGGLSGTRRAIAAATAMTTREVMEDSITDGTGKKLKDILRYTAFGKSGTAQLAGPDKRYLDSRYMSSFVIGAPFDDPKIAVLITIEDPDLKKTGASYGGGALAGPCAAHVVNGVLEYLGVPNDGELVYAKPKALADAR